MCTGRITIEKETTKKAMWELLVIISDKIFINYTLAVTNNLLPEVKEPTHSSVLSHFEKELFWEYLQSRTTPSEKETINYAIMQISIQYVSKLTKFASIQPHFNIQNTSKIFFRHYFPIIQKLVSLINKKLYTHENNRQESLVYNSASNIMHFISYYAHWSFQRLIKNSPV